MVSGVGRYGGRGTCLEGKRSGLGVVKGARGKLEEKRTIKDNKQIYVVQVVQVVTKGWESL